MKGRVGSVVCLRLSGTALVALFLAASVHAQVRRFERQQSHEMMDPAGKLPGAAWPPGPYLRQDVVEHRNARAPCRSGEDQVELGIIDQHEQIRRIVAEETAQRAERPDCAANRRAELGHAEPGFSGAGGQR